MKHKKVFVFVFVVLWSFAFLCSCGSQKVEEKIISEKAVDIDIFSSVTSDDSKEELQINKTNVYELCKQIIPYIIAKKAGRLIDVDYQEKTQELYKDNASLLMTIETLFDNVTVNPDCVSYSYLLLDVDKNGIDDFVVYETDTQNIQAIITFEAIGDTVFAMTKSDCYFSSYKIDNESLTVTQCRLLQDDTVIFVQYSDLIENNINDDLITRIVVTEPKNKVIKEILSRKIDTETKEKYYVSIENNKDIRIEKAIYFSKVKKYLSKRKDLVGDLLAYE